MDIGEIVNIGFLKEQGYNLIYPDIFEFETGQPKICVYTHKEKGIDLKIERIPEMPEIYKITMKIPTPK